MSSNPSVYDVTAIEHKWQEQWERQRAFACLDGPPSQPRFYCLVMFPYPSGRIHMGHVRNYTIGDVLARFHRMRGACVLHPIGWDAFGLPAENAAIQHGVDPERWTRENIAEMRRQLEALGISYDWDREIATCDPSYYRWNQWFFIKMFERGLAYRAQGLVNWCPSCQTVLANEQVHDGVCWRCHTAVTQQALQQWFLRITAYAEELLEDHRLLTEGWPEEVLLMQRHWIGKSVGAEVEFPVWDDQRKAVGELAIRIFTTRPDTLFGATFMVLAPEHPLIERLVTPACRPALEQFRERLKQATIKTRAAADRPKEGVFLGKTAINPVNQERLPIWVAEYVMMEYGTGAIMAVPAHDQRDLEFTLRHGLPVREVIRPPSSPSFPSRETAYEGPGTLINSGRFSGLDSETATEQITAWLVSQGKGKGAVTYKLRDWLISRQRYWGTPIPIVHCQGCGLVPVSESELPVVLPTGVQFTGSGESPLAQCAEFRHIRCPRCAHPAERETDTMDTFVDSSWYYARYVDPQNDHVPFDRERVNAWLPVHQYIGGIEHACMHLIYARFWHKVMRDLGLVTSDEPFARLLTQGMVTLGGAAMSKSRGNVVDPSDIITRYGADTARLFILFAAPPEKQLEWTMDGVEGAWRFLNRVWRLVERLGTSKDMSRPTSPALERIIHRTIHRVTRDIERSYQFNTAIAATMELVNALTAYPALGDEPSRNGIKTLLVLLAPFAPHIGAELWERMGLSGDVHRQPWPQADPAWLTGETVDLVIQVDGKVRGRITVPQQTTEVEARSQALQHPKVQVFVGQRSISRVIYIPKRLINIVTNTSPSEVP
ncbi:MAG: leucine--tRNA ligase [Elusimicrobia bacterium]|nr:leucine--tRNA ligase [Elusimicrobiota bacterium]